MTIFDKFVLRFVSNADYLYNIPKNYNQPFLQHVFEISIRY